MKPKNQRLVLVALAVSALVGAVLLAMWGLKDRAAYFVTPSDLAAHPQVERSLRLGGMVEQGSVHRAADGLRVEFTVTDFKASTPVSYRGILPDLFREGSGVVAEGRMTAGGLFEADNILAKHDERYLPPPIARAMEAGRADNAAASSR